MPNEIIIKNWKDGIAPAECIGQCNLIEGGGELKCYACGWSDCTHLENNKLITELKIAKNGK